MYKYSPLGCSTSVYTHHDVLQILISVFSPFSNTRAIVNVQAIQLQGNNVATLVWNDIWLAMARTARNVTIKLSQQH